MASTRSKKNGGRSKYFRNHGPLGLLEAITKHFDRRGRHVATTFHRRKKTVRRKP